MIALSSNHFSVDIQAMDAVGSLSDADRARFDAEFPEYDRAVATIQGTSSWHDPEESGLDPEYMSWVVDWLEANTPITWLDGEPVIWEAGDDCEDDDCFLCRG